MMRKNLQFSLVILIFSIVVIACSWTVPKGEPTDKPGKVTLPVPSASPTSRPTPTPLPQNPIEINDEESQEPVFISGEIEYSSRFFLNSFAEPFVMLEDQAGFVRRDENFEFRLQSQVIGPVEVLDENKLNYYLSLPVVPQGTFVDVDQDGNTDQGVQVFAIAYWSNTWGDPFLESRDGTGWSSAYASTITDPENNYEITGGTLIVWAPDEEQQFPTGFGADGKLFTEDDPTAKISPGYNLIDLNNEPFSFTKETNPIIDLIEGEIATNDFSDLSFSDAFEMMFSKVSKEYPFTEEKEIDWAKLEQKFLDQSKRANDEDDFYKIVQEFSQSFPDGHANISFNSDVFYEQYGGGFGLLLTELSDGKVIATTVLPDLPADEAGIEAGAEIIEWDGKPISETIAGVTPGFGPYSTDHTRRIAQTGFLTRTSPRSTVSVEFLNPGQAGEKQRTMRSVVEYETVFRLISVFDEDLLALPVEGQMLQDSGLAYIRVNTFSDDYQFMARLWEHFISSILEEDVPGVIIDLRNNGGGSLGLALDFAGYFFDEEFSLYRSAYYSNKTDAFEYQEHSARVKPAPIYYDGKVAVLIGPDCVSACEGFAYALSYGGRAKLVGHYPTAGAFGEVGRGQYQLPADISLQFPTGRPETLDGKLLIEGEGVKPDLLVPVTLESAVGDVDSVLDAAINALLEMIG